MSEPTLAVIYARLSKQGETAESMIRQDFDCRAMAEKLGAPAVAFEESKGHRSGRSEKNRPAWRQCLEYLERNHRKVKYFIVQDSDRVSRDVVTRLSFLHRLEEWGIMYISLLEPQFQQPMPAAELNMMHGMNAVVAQHYADFLSEKQKNRIRSVKERGGKIGHAPRGTIAVGHGAERHFVRGDEKVLAVLAAMLEEYVTRQPGGERLVTTMAKRGYKLPDRFGNWRPVQESDWVTLHDALDAYDGILDADLLRRVRQRMAMRANHQENGGRRGRNPRVIQVLNHLVFCDRCGARYWTATENREKEHKIRNLRAHKRLHRAGWLHYLRHPLWPNNCPTCGKFFPSLGIEEQLWQELAQFFVLTEEQRRAVAAHMAAKKSEGNTYREKRDRLNKSLQSLEEKYVDPDNSNGELLSKARYIELRRRIIDEMAVIPFDLGLDEMTESEALQRLEGVTTLLSSHVELHSDQVNEALHGVFARVYLSADGRITGYTPWGWCAELFPPDRIVKGR